MRKPTKRQIVSTLKKARKLIEKPENWCQGAFARDGRGAATDVGSRDACRWCARGAIRENTRDNWMLESLAFEALVLAVPKGTSMNSPVLFNDEPGRKHAAVLRLFDKALAKLEAA